MLSSTLADIKCSSVHASGGIYMNISPVAGNGGGGSGARFWSTSTKLFQAVQVAYI